MPLLWAGCIVAVIAAGLVARSLVSTRHAAPATTIVPRTASAPAPTTTSAPLPAPPFHQRPFTVAQATGQNEWTADDGRNPDVIRQLAHNDLEYRRMLDENARILRRQLVYRTDTVAAAVERARAAGEQVRQLTLPALDGQELQFEISASDLSPSGQRGTFSGHLVGRPDSLVTLAFKGGREAFTVISPSDGIYLQADPRDPGEVIIKSIDPDTYVAGLCGTP